MRWMVPNSASNAALPSTAATRPAREDAVGNNDRYWDMVAATIAPNTRPHSTPGPAARLAVVTATARAARPSSYTSLRRIGGPLGHDLGSVVGEEQLLQRGLLTDEMVHARPGQHG